MNLEPYFKRYQQIVLLADTVFDKMVSEYADCVACKLSCADCCHAIFDLTLIEAMHVNRVFHEKLSQAQKERVLQMANRADRDVYRLKRKAYKRIEGGEPEIEVVAWLSSEKVRCPLLGEEDLCLLYEHRPVTCRLYGVPTQIAGHSHVCGKSKFEQGRPYPTVDVEKIQDRLYAISSDFAKSIKSKYSELATILVPVSMALLTNYDDEYLGIGSQSEK